MFERLNVTGIAGSQKSQFKLLIRYRHIINNNYEIEISLIRFIT